MLALFGASTGALLATISIPVLRQLLPRDVPRLDTVHFDATAVGSVILAALLVALMLALLPARTGGAVGYELASQSTRLAPRSRATWLIVAEAALALVLAVLASLTVRSFDRLRSVDVGFDPASLLAVRVGLEDESSTVSPTVVFDALLERIRATPGVQAAGITSVRPFGDGGAATSFGPLGSRETDQSTLPVADVRLVDPGYFATLQLTPLTGRVFTGREQRGTPMQAVVNEAVLGALWPGEPNAVGRKFALRMYDNASPEIIGVVRDIRLQSPRLAPRPTVYLSAAQFPNSAFDVVVRSALPELVLLPSVRAAVQGAAPGTPVFRIASVERAISDSMARERVTAILLAFFAVAALLLVAVGVYGLFAGEVARGRQEIGVRMALGESAPRLVRSMLSRALKRVVLGLLIGGGASFLATRAMGTLLYDVVPTDLMSHVVATAVVLVTALGATLIPALQAARVDPARALRAE
jgi:putative ABC transport system permease protein